MLFSIIVPMYNAEKFIERCLKSILKQTYEKYEVLIVDDGSTDSSMEKACRMSKEDLRLKIFQIPHSGPGAARNRGLSEASGEYVLFMDADDYWMDMGILEKLNGLIQHQHTEVFMYQMVKVTEDEEILARYKKPPFYHDNVVLKLKDVYMDLVRDGQALASACNKCVSKKLLDKHSIKFLEDTNGEDIDWVLQLFSYVRTICLLNMDVYAYTQHKIESRSTSKDAPNDLVAIVERWSQLLKQGQVPHARAVAGLVAFEYGICMGHNHSLSKEKRQVMRAHEYLLKYGLDRKTRLIHRFYKMFGYTFTCFAIRIYLNLRRIW